MFRVSQHPSSGVLKIIPEASGTDYTTCTATPPPTWSDRDWFVRVACDSQKLLYTTSCKRSLVLLRMGEIIARNMLSGLKLLIVILFQTN